MNDKPNRNRPVFRPQTDENETVLDGAAADETTPLVEEAEGTEERKSLPEQEPAPPRKNRFQERAASDRAPRESWGGRRPSPDPGTSDDYSRPARTDRPEKEEPPATVAPTGKSAFASAGGGTRGRLRTVSETGAPGAPSDRDRGERGREAGRDRDYGRDRERERGRDRDRGSSGSRTPVPGAGGDTVPVMRSVDYDPGRGRGGRNAPGGRGPQRPGGGGRSTQLPKPRRHTVSTPGRFGFFGFFFGLIGLIIRMLIVTVLVGGIVGVASYFIIQAYIKTPTVLVPNVRGMRIQEAFESLSTKKLGMVQERSEPSALVAPGEVIEQRPAPGTNTKEGTTVRLVVSSGKSNYVVPDVRGETRDTAVNKIKGAQLEVGNITFLPDDKVAKDSVITQNPEPNKGLEQPVKVDLLISSGAPGSSLTMPDVTNVTVNEARARLTRLGVSDIAVDPPDADPNATVAAQEPLVGKMILQSQKVTLQIKR